MNRVDLIGRLTADPQVKTGRDNTVIARYTLAVARRTKDGEQAADFIRCVTFNKTAEFAEKYLKKGMKIAVTGEWRTGSYTDQGGNKVYTNEMIVQSHEFCESKQENTRPEAVSDDFVNDVSDEELPFR